jgi:transcriptional regulator with XRE-family HTH domain
MNATIKLLDKYREVCSLSSDNACAVRLGVTRSAVSLWRLQKGHPDADSVERMCAATNEPLAKWLPLIEAERARSPAARKVWLRLAQAAASIAVIYAFSRLDVHSMESLAFAPFAFIHYAKLNNLGEQSPKP